MGDALRVATLVSAGATVAWFGGHGAIAFLRLFALLLLPGWLKVAVPLDAAFCATMLPAAWSRQQHWYVPWWDEAVHSATPGTVAVAAHLMLGRLDLLPDVQETMGATRRFSVVLLVMFVGLGLATMWEFYEWVANQVHAPDDTWRLHRHHLRPCPGRGRICRSGRLSGLEGPRDGDSRATGRRSTPPPNVSGPVIVAHRLHKGRATPRARSD